MLEFIKNQLDWVLFSIIVVGVLVAGMVFRARVLAYVSEVRQEWTRVTTPTREESIAHTSVVIVAVLISAGYMFGVDTILKLVTDILYR
ncbi:preprotein translocase subunit SecE [Candidatus Poribacteria bacterium]|nr:preprotein translocase subunit SecE [Candidatus Poribacteria bacterium]